MTGKKKTGPKLPPVPAWDEEKADEGVPRTTMPEEGTPEPVTEEHDSLRSFTVLDERQFMMEVCERLNAFCNVYPQEAMHLLNNWLPYQHELIEPSREMEERRLEADGQMPIVDDDDLGITVGALFAGLLQTRQGKGYYVRPVAAQLPSDPDVEIIIGFEVVQQDYEDSTKN